MATRFPTLVNAQGFDKSGSFNDIQIANSRVHRPPPRADRPCAFHGPKVTNPGTKAMQYL